MMNKSTKILFAMVLLLGFMVVRGELQNNSQHGMFKTIEASGMSSQLTGSILHLYTVSADAKTLTIYSFDKSKKDKTDAKLPRFIGATTYTP